MEFKSTYITPDIKLSCYDDKLFKTEVMFEHHMLIWFISGESKIIQSGSSFVFQAGDIFLVPRNQVTTIINYPKDDLPHKTVVMNLSVDKLRRYYAKLDITPLPSYHDRIHSFKKHPLLRSCLSSLVPYFDLKENLPEKIGLMKIDEALTVIRMIDDEVDGILANFAVPEKTDLVKFMETHYMFNLPMQKFSYLTGRSLSTFNRDFRKRFNMAPQRWLTQRRLELAHRQIVTSMKRPVDVYLEVGFEDLSHFSFAFKKFFGYAPTSLTGTSGRKSGYKQPLNYCQATERL